MDFSMIGSIRNYTKTLELQTKWNQKKASGDVTAHETSERDIIQRQVNEDRGKEKLREIKAKLEAGVKLTGDEKKYLKSEDPEAYQELEDQEREQKEFERALKRCRTKEEVQRLKLSKLGTSLTKLKSVENNPNISLEKKLKIFTDEQKKLDRFEESTKKFVQSGEYGKLPDESEAAKAEREERETEEAKRTPEATETRPAPEGEKPEQSQDGKPEKAETVETEVKPSEAKKPSIETESPEARKVRRAKAKAAYGGQAELSEMPRPQLDARG